MSDTENTTFTKSAEQSKDLGEHAATIFMAILLMAVTIGIGLAGFADLIDLHDVGRDDPFLFIGMGLLVVAMITLTEFILRLGFFVLSDSDTFRKSMEDLWKEQDEENIGERKEQSLIFRTPPDTPEARESRRKADRTSSRILLFCICAVSCLLGSCAHIYMEDFASSLAETYTWESDPMMFIVQEGGKLAIMLASITLATVVSALLMHQYQMRSTRIDDSNEKD